jgi:hypothetical protein
MFWASNFVGENAAATATAQSSNVFVLMGGGRKNHPPYPDDKIPEKDSPKP